MKKIIFSVLFLGLSVAQAESVEKKCDSSEITNLQYGFQYLQEENFKKAVCSALKFKEPEKAPKNFKPSSYKGPWPQGIQYLAGNEFVQAIYLLSKK